MTAKKRLHANVLRAGSIHIAVIDAAPLYTFHHGELHLAQSLSGIVIALVGLVRILRVSKLSTSAAATNEFKDMTPKSVLATSSANSTRKAHVLQSVRMILGNVQMTPSPRPAPAAQEKTKSANSLPMILRSVLVSRTKTTASDGTSAGHVACETQRGRLDLAPHGAPGGFASCGALDLEFDDSHSFLVTTLPRCFVAVTVPHDNFTGTVNTAFG